MLRCDICSYGTYALFENSTECTLCFKNAICEGGTNVRVPSGYWRSSNQSATVHKCLNDEACTGGFGTATDGASPCAKGYGGNLCDACVKDEDGNNYERLTGRTCSKCPNKEANIVRVVGLVILILIVVLLMIWYLYSYSYIEL